MTAEELKQLVSFRETEGPFESTIVHGSVEFEHSITIDRNCPRQSDAIAQAKEIIREAIARRIYDDQRKELYRSLEEFIRWSTPMPGCYRQFDEAQNKLMQAARYQEKV